MVLMFSRIGSNMYLLYSVRATSALFRMALSYSKTSVGSDWNESVLNNRTSESSFFHDGEATGANFIISCPVLYDPQWVVAR